MTFLKYAHTAEILRRSGQTAGFFDSSTRRDALSSADGATFDD